MALASTASDLLTGVCMALVLGMGGLLVYRGSRKRPQDREDDER
ncbi:hypothetical protein [Patulibacter sp. SYSU D01012]|nr:hypothetical protein [Patulibacter sp. SYSU D01012]